MSVTKYAGEEALQELVIKMKAYADGKGLTVIAQDSIRITDYDAGAYIWRPQAAGNAHNIYYSGTEGTEYVTPDGAYLGDLTLFIGKSRTSVTNYAWVWMLLCGDCDLYVGHTTANSGSCRHYLIDKLVQHSDVINNLTTTTFVQGQALHARQGKVLKDLIDALTTTVNGKQDILTFDTTPTENSTKPVTSGGVYSGLNAKVDKVAGKGLSTDDFVSANYYTKTQVDGMISSVYKPAGSVTFASLPTLAASVLGNVYNVTDSFTTTSDFVEGSGTTYPAGTNVVVVDASSTSTPDYKFDVLSGFVDLSGYQPLITSSNKLDYSLIVNTPTIPDTSNMVTTNTAQTISGAKTFTQSPVTINGDIIADYVKISEVVHETTSTFDKYAIISTTSYVRYRTKAEMKSDLDVNNFINYTTTAPSAANTTGLKVALLDGEPTTKYDGWIYMIKE